MKVGLDSDFRDFYDHWFDLLPCDRVLQRASTQGPSKREQFELLESIGFAVPLHGLVKDVWNKATSDYLVVYEDEQLHCGEGKKLYHRTLAALKAGNKYCSTFIPTTQDEVTHAVSRRLLAIGDRMWWLRYESKGSWMSNHAPDVNVIVQGETLSRQTYALEGELDFSPLQSYPLFAIDFVESLSRKQLMAIDFNSAPGLKNTGMEEILKASEVVKLIAEHFQLLAIAPPNPAPS